MTTRRALIAAPTEPRPSPAVFDLARALARILAAEQFAADQAAQRPRPE